MKQRNGTEGNLHCAGRADLCSQLDFLTSSDHTTGLRQSGPNYPTADQRKHSSARVPPRKLPVRVESRPLRSLNSTTAPMHTLYGGMGDPAGCWAAERLGDGARGAVAFLWCECSIEADPKLPGEIPEGAAGKRGPCEPARACLTQKVRLP